MADRGGQVNVDVAAAITRQVVAMVIQDLLNEAAFRAPYGLADPIEISHDDRAAAAALREYAERLRSFHITDMSTSARHDEVKRLRAERDELMRLGGWVAFGTHSELGPIDQQPPLEFAGRSDAGDPLWERPMPDRQAVMKIAHGEDHVLGVESIQDLLRLSPWQAEEDAADRLIASGMVRVNEPKESDGE